MKIFHGFNIKFIKGDIYGGITAAIIALPIGLAWGSCFWSWSANWNL